MVKTDKIARTGRKLALLLAGYVHAVSQRRSLLARPTWTAPGSDVPQGSDVLRGSDVTPDRRTRAASDAPPADGEVPPDDGGGRDSDEPIIVETPFIGGLRGWVTVPRRVFTDAEWASLLRRFARGAVWAMPVAAVLFALSAAWGWPGPGGAPSGPSAGTWLVVTLFALVLAIVGMVALTALLAATAGRHWALGALLATVLGTLLFAPMLGVLGVARTAVAGTAGDLQPGVAADLDGRFFDGTVGRWLLVGGLSLVAVGWFALGCAIAASEVLNRIDGELIVVAVGIGVLGAYLSSQIVLVFAAMPLLAAALGTAWTASRLTPYPGAPHEAARLAEEDDELLDGGDRDAGYDGYGYHGYDGYDGAHRGDGRYAGNGGPAAGYRERLAGQHMLRTRELATTSYPVSYGRRRAGGDGGHLHARGRAPGDGQVSGDGHNRGRARAAGDNRSG